MSESRDVNPYPGPRPFEQADRLVFFGRDRERRELVSLIVAHSLVLLYAASGAGKTSLLNAAVIPALEEEEGFHVVPPLRIRPAAGLLDPPAGVNAFVFSVLSNLVRDLRLELARSELAGMSLVAFFARLDSPHDARGLPAPRVVIFDQFEELFTVHPEFWSHREAFVREIGELLDTKRETEPMRIVFSMREDHLAELAPYAHLMPDGFRIRRRLDRLEKEPALRAVTGPLKGTGRAFRPGVAETLVEDLLKQRIERPGLEVPDDPEVEGATGAGRSHGAPEGQSMLIEGQFVEPVQLQVVCSTLWDELPADVTEIEHRHVQSFGNVDQVLGRFYDDAVAVALRAAHVREFRLRHVRAALRAARVRESRLRQWIESTLITAGGTRGTVYRGASATAGLPNVAADALENKRMIRAEWRAGAPWYELTHDRLIEPIRSSNRRFAHQRQRRIVRWALVVAVASAVVAAAVTVPLVVLTGETTEAAQPKLMPQIAKFGRTLVGGLPRERSVTLQLNSEPMTIRSVAIRAQPGTDPEAFRATPTRGSCRVGKTLDAGESCNVQVAFSPRLLGGKAATLRVTGDRGESLEAKLLGTGSYLTVTPDAVDFGRVRGYRNVDVVIAYAKQAVQEKTRVELESAGDFNLTFNSCTSSNPGTSCTVTVTFIQSVEPGERTGVLKLMGAPEPVEVVLSGRGA